MWHGYFGIENIGLNASQKQALIAELRKLGPASNPQPAQLNHWRTRLDGDAAIFEALFDEVKIDIPAIKQHLAKLFGIDPTSISHATQNTQYGPVVTFTRNVDRIRMVLFGGVGSSWEESRQKVIAYLRANKTDWEPGTI